MTERTKKDFTAYRMDYSVYILRAEMRALGRELELYEDEWDEDYKTNVRLRMQQIKDTLSMLKLIK
ncbi:hypothetical protein ABE073_04590 [Lederbergia citrisecunda]|uniref:hypothetical protein n=1 Tax=Lederbergia citrisecunda TaxID=2833583 RepID=UPI003D2ACD26